MTDARRPAIDRERLDPFTLRFVADEHAADAARFEEYARTPLRNEKPDVAVRLRQLAYEHRMEAKRLRSLATRIERARGVRR